MNGHKIIVIPSRWQEPFGIVALEGIACGCVAVGSAQGGLADAIGPCGITFENGDVSALTKALAVLLMNPELLVQYKNKAATHLEKFKRACVCESYFNIISAAAEETGVRRVG